MLIPLRDEVRPKKRPYVVYVLIGINVLIWFVELGLRLSNPVAFEAFMSTFGFIPRALFINGDLTRVIGLFTHMFLHDAPRFDHILLNMLFLWVFGPNIENAFGRLWFIGFYIICGLFGALMHGLTTLNTFTLLIGASGAISGLLGSYIILYPKTRLMSLFLLLFIRMVYIPAWIYIGIWFVIQLFYGVATLGRGGGVAFLAHVGGFIAGLLISYIFKKRLLRNIYPTIEYY